MSRRRGRARALGLLLGAAVALGAGCSDDGSGAASDRATTTTAAATPLPGPPSDPAVVGTWTAPGTDQLHAVLAEQGLDEVPVCRGTLDLELGEDGGFTRTLAGTCAFADGDGEVELVTTGGYRTQGGDLVLADASGTGTLRGADGSELALPTSDETTEGTVTYTVTDVELTLSIVEDGDGVVEGGVVEETFIRS